MTETTTYQTVSQVAQAARVCTQIVRRWVAAGLLQPGARTLSGVSLFTGEEVARWLTERARNPRRPIALPVPAAPLTVPVYLTYNDILARARISYPLVQKWVRKGRLRLAAQTLNGWSLFDPTEVEQWIAEWTRIRRRPYRRLDSRIPGLDEVPALPACLIPPPIPRTGRRGLAVVSGRDASAERRPA